MDETRGLTRRQLLRRLGAIRQVLRFHACILAFSQKASHCGIGFWGGQCLSLAEYARGPAATRAATAAAAC